MYEILDTYNFDIDNLNLSYKELSKLPDLTRFIELKTFNCIYNKLLELNNLPNSLITLYCSNNQLTELNNLPNTLTTLYCSGNQLTTLNKFVSVFGNLFNVVN